MGDLFVASNSGASAHDPLAVILGIAVVLIFAGIVVRAIVRRGSRSRPAPAATSTRGSAPVGATDSNDPASSDAAAAPPALPQPLADVPEPELVRVTSETLAPLAQTLDRARRLRAAEDRVAGELESLPAGFWLVERYALVGTRRIPFLVAGATGVFVICATDGAWSPHDLHVLSDAGDDVCSQLPGYDGRVHAVMCLAFDEMKPRSWYGGEAEQGRGGWVMGLDWLKRWMFSFGPEHGLFNGDVRRLQEASGPFWGRRSTARLPASRNRG